MLGPNAFIISLIKSKTWAFPTRTGHPSLPAYDHLFLLLQLHFLCKQTSKAIIQL